MFIVNIEANFTKQFFCALISKLIRKAIFRKKQRGKITKREENLLSKIAKKINAILLYQGQKYLTLNYCQRSYLI